MHPGKDNIVKVYLATPIDGVTESQRSALLHFGQQLIEKDYPDAVVFFPLSQYDAQVREINIHGPRVIAESDMNEIANCDGFVALQPQASKGVHWELGYVTGLNSTRSEDEKIQVRILSCECLEGKPSMMLSIYETEHWHHQ